jgi:nucleoside-diphosphate-sugar epimerase
MPVPENEARPLRVILFGATGMVGSAVLTQCLADPAVEAVLSVGRRPSGFSHPKFGEVIHTDFFDYSAVKERLRGYNACFFTLGLSSLGRSEAEYTRDTHDLTLAAARALLEVNPGMSICYVSGQGTDSSEKGKSMWARVKGRTENELLAMPFGHAAMIRLAGLQAAPGFRPKTFFLRAVYAVLSPLFPLLKKILPSGMVLDGPTLGRALIRAAQGGTDKKILQPRDLAELGA